MNIWLKNKTNKQKHYQSIFFKSVFCKIERVLLYSQSTPWKPTTREDFKSGTVPFY